MQRLLTCLALFACLPSPSLAAERWAGRRVVEIVESLRAGGLNILYSSDLLSEDLRVESEPTATAGLALLIEALAPHGLTLRLLPGGVLAVVAAAPPPVAPGAAGAGGEDGAAPTAALREIVVAASRYHLAADLPNVHVFLTPSELEALPRVGEETLKAVERLPGTAGDGYSGLAHVRGGLANETEILLDGLPLHEPFHLRNALSPVSLLNAQVIGSLDVHLGGFPAVFGNRMSAVIDVKSLEPEAERYHELGLSLFHASALAARRFDEHRGQWLLAARRSNLRDLARLAESPEARPFYFDVFGRLRYDLSDASRATLRFLASDDAIDAVDRRSGESSRATFQNGYVWATLERAWSDELRSDVSLSWTEVRASRFGTVSQPGRRSGRVSDLRRYRIAGLKADATWERGRWAHAFGFDLRDARARYDYSSERVFAPDYPFPGSPGSSLARDLAPRVAGAHVALYASSRWQATDRLLAEVGLRWDTQDYNAESDADHQFGPRLNLAYSLDDRTRLRLAWGRFQQFQDVNELEVEDGVDRFREAQSAEHLIAAVERDLDDALSLRIEVYRKRYDDLRPRFENLFDPVAWLPELAADRVEVAPNSGSAEGLELLLTLRNAGPWSGWLGYTWSRATDRLGGRDVPRSWDQPHTVSAGVNWSSGPWNATAAALWHSGWPTTAVALAPDGSVIVGPRNGARLPSFASLDFKVARRFDVARGELSAFLEVSNATGRSNPCCVTWSAIPGGGAATTALAKDYDHWLPLVPSLGVLWKF